KHFKFHYEKSYNINDANSDVNKEIEKQLPDSTPETTIRKRKERAQKIFHLFSKPKDADHWSGYHEPVDITESVTSSTVLEVLLTIDNPIPASSKLSEDRKTDAFLDEMNKKNPEDKVSCEEKGIRLDRLPPALQEPSPSLVVRKIPYNQKVEQGIIQKVISFIQKEAFASSINTSKFNIVIADGEGQDLAQLYSDVEDTEGKMIKAKQKENIHWYIYRESYKNKVAEICSKTGIAEKTAKSQVYAMIKASLPNVSKSNLYKKTERAGSVYRLFGKIIDPATKKEVIEIGIDKVYEILYGSFLNSCDPADRLDQSECA
ncbi:23798_t:CDS:2, partial [Racocetra persica]